MISWLFAAAAVFSFVLFFVALPPAGTVAALILTGLGVSSMLPLLITTLRKDGYEFVTMSELAANLQ